MNKHRRKFLFSFGLLFAVIITIPIVYALTREVQTTTTKAQAATTLSFSPVSSEMSPLARNPGDVIPLTIVLTPGTNHISVVSLEITYDKAVFSLAESGAFSANNDAFPRIVEGPIFSPGKIQVSLSIGADPTRAITKQTVIGTLTFKTLTATSKPSKISFDANTKVLSVATNDEANENVLSLANPAFVAVSGILPIASPSHVAKTNSQAMRLAFSLSLLGIGSKTTTPENNPVPKHTSRNITYELTTRDHERVLQTTLPLTYDVKTGFYKGVSHSLPSQITPGLYYLSIEMGGYLKKQYPILISLQPGTQVQLPTLSLTPGDTDTDGRLTAFDYGILLDCYSKTSRPMSDPRSEYNSKNCLSHEGRANADINDDGIIDMTDLAFYQTSSSN